MKLQEVQAFCKELLAKVAYPRVGTIIGLQEEIGKLAEVIMDIEIYGKPFDKNILKKSVQRYFSVFLISVIRMTYILIR
jgi:hypothetical protein